MKFRTITYLFLSIGMLSCTKEQIDNPRGNLDSIRENFSEQEAVGLRCLDAVDGTLEVTLTYGAEESVQLDFQAYSTAPLKSSRQFQIREDAGLVKSYSDRTGVEYRMLPAFFSNLLDVNQFEISSGNSESAVQHLRVACSTPKYGGKKLEPGKYLLPLVFDEDMDHPIYIDLTVREVFKGDYELYQGQEMFFCFYVNTSQYDPRIVTDYNMQWDDPIGERQVSSIGNLLNLRKSVISVDEEQNPVLVLYSDLKYVLEHREKYLLPVQESGRKVCLCIEGGGKGLGFCNLAEEQIESLTDQIVGTVRLYGLDGVNLWDRGSNYGLEGMPEMNTTSYPKFIRRLREKLAHDRLLTLVDFEEPTASFWDKAACGGIEVGKYIDYAWSGYNRNTEPFQVVDPWNQGKPAVSLKYPRRPILGMSPERYGCVNAYWRSGKMDFSIYDDAVAWEAEGMRRSNLFVFEDLRSNLQDGYEGGAWNVGEYLSVLLNAKGDDLYRSFDFIPMNNDKPGTNGYGKWLKDW